MENWDIVRIAANRLAAILFSYVGMEWLGTDSDGKLILPLQPFGLASIRFPLGFTVPCPVCWLGWVQPVEHKDVVSFFRSVFSETGGVKLTGFRCESKSCVLNKQIVPNAMMMEVMSNRSFTVESRVLAYLVCVSKVGDIDSKKDHLRVASILSTGTAYQSIIQDIYTEVSQIMPPVSQDQWRRLDELVDSTALRIVKGGNSK